MGFATDKLGVWTEEREFKVEADRTKAYAAATNDAVPAHTAGTVAPPVFAVVPVWDALVESMASVVPEDALFSVVHGEQDIYYRKPLVPGTVVRSRAATVGVHVKPSGTTVVSKAETRDESGELLVEQYFVAFFRGFSEGTGAGEEAPDHRLTDDAKADEPVAVVTQQLDADQTYRYADASGDRMPIHLDDDFAKSVGLPGIIIHGLCTMAFTSWGVLHALGGDDPSRLHRLAVRFSKPVLPGQAITTRMWKVGAGGGTTSFGFETTNPDGDLVIKDGLAEIGD
ncbi:MAG: MaoC/PaaZ C-terminal domain-containing protein [Acidimicrobiia bacterium]